MSLFRKGIWPSVAKWDTIQVIWERYRYNIMENKNWAQQGGPLSSLIFQIFSDNLLNKLQDCSHGVNIYDVEVASLAFADDLDIIYLSTNGLQNISDISYRNSIKWRLIFSAPKCIVMTFDHHLDNKQYTWEVLMEVTFCTILGKLLFSIPEHEFQEVENRIAKAYRNLCILKWFGLSRVQMNTMTFSRGCDILYEYICIWRSVWLISIIWPYIIWCLA